MLNDSPLMDHRSFSFLPFFFFFLFVPHELFFGHFLPLCCSWFPSEFSSFLQGGIYQCQGLKAQRTPAQHL